MSEVVLRVGGRPYTLSCADGEEDHVHHLAAMVDAKLSAMGANGAPGDARNLLFAALILADEAEEARGREQAAADPAFADNIARGLEALAGRLEQVAQRLENGRDIT